MSGFGIYVHWPFCAAKCPYCDFNSHVREHIEESRWADAVALELRHLAALQGGSRPAVDSIFFGGGTPSLTSGRAAGAVLDAVARLWRIAPEVEITLEANPNSVEQARFRDYRAAGVNRVSIGVQALDPAALKELGRLHDVAEAKRAIGLALATFPRVSFDLIYARPGQSVAAWRCELGEAVAFGTEHLSLYQLTIEPGTAFATRARLGQLTLPDEDTSAALYEATSEICGRAGLAAYEVSNHARAGAESRHNLNYWCYGDYAGVGPGAHGRLTLGGRRIATEAVRLPERWLSAVEREGHGLTETEIAPAEAAHEHLLMNLRLTEGLHLAAYESRWGVALDAKRIAALAEDGLVCAAGGRLRATLKGRLVLNALIAELAPQTRKPTPSRVI
jgi:putative oxygen-independent coproporphyrinogen III oxidase